MISKRDMRNSLIRSGYLLEQRIHHVLDDNGYYVETNTPYPDEITGKSRELDINAITSEYLGAGDFLWWTLLCSCVNNSQPLAFFMRESLIPFMHYESLKISGLPVQVPDPTSGRGEFEQLTEYLRLDLYHHYRQPRISTQYCSFAQKRGRDSEWYATHVEEHHDSMSALGVACEAEITDHYANWRVVPGEEGINVQVYFLVLVLQGDLYEVDVENSQMQVTPSNHVLFRETHHSTNRRDEYFVDVVRESYFPSYVDIVDNEMMRMARAMRRRKTALRESIDILVRRVGKRRNVRAVFEF